MDIDKVLINRNQIDWVGYEKLIDFLLKKKIHCLEGDFVEIGTLFGGGARKLSKFLEECSPEKTLYVIDIFDPLFDKTENTEGRSMAHLYCEALRLSGFTSQWEVFQRVTNGCKNIKVLKSDSKKAIIPSDKIAFAFIDGNHSPEYVLNDFYLIWDKLVPGGCIAFDDFEHDLPQVTEAINQIISKLSDQLKVSDCSESYIIYLTKTHS